MTHEAESRKAAVRRLERGLPLYRVMDVTRPKAWADLDEDVRQAVRHGALAPFHGWLTGIHGPGWRGLRDRAADRVREEAPTEARLALALCDPDGRIRQAALSCAAGRPEVLPLVAVRAADWAAPVRARALHLLREALPGASARTLAVTAPVILRLDRRLRGGAAAELLDGLLRGGDPARVKALLSDCRDGPTRRAALSVALDRGLYDGLGLALVAAGDHDPVVQERAASAAVAADEPDATVPVLLGARFGRVRAAGVTALRGAGRHAEAEPYLYDRSGRTRACARWVLRQGGGDPLLVYRTACAGPDVPVRAPLGLGECGARSVDVPLLRELTGHRNGRVRASAVAGLRLLDAAEPRRMKALLDDPEPAVVREARRALWS
ncbi:hypothetical protein HHL19_25325 [Streptomyces sp. R302]|uniref:hypothetical protein n=1 Tax=unclassified Streptomyces TaxID=2593676 RepID=UPI00145C6A93|nr:MULTISPECIES: hypothetical protein [unclassified Streptomyces]NML53525.1 hypothetical protein [Streptomyces sp. R301]NML81886.1 hypothetical protein [Streptomyces sp. R302]